MGSPLFRLLATLLVVFAGIVLLSLPFILMNRRLPAPLTTPVVLNDSGSSPPDSLPLDSARVAAALGSVTDPELDLAITDLGLVESLLVDNGEVRAVLALTRPECPFGLRLGRDALAALKAVPGVRRVAVKVDPNLRWYPSRMGPAAKDRFYRFFTRDTGRGR